MVHRVGRRPLKHGLPHKLLMLLLFQFFLNDVFIVQGSCLLLAQSCSSRQIALTFLYLLNPQIKILVLPRLAVILLPLLLLLLLLFGTTTATYFFDEAS